MLFMQFLTCSVSECNTKIKYNAQLKVKFSSVLTVVILMLDKKSIYA